MLERVADIRTSLKMEKKKSFSAFGYFCSVNKFSESHLRYSNKDIACCQIEASLAGATWYLTNRPIKWHHNHLPTLRFALASSRRCAQVNQTTSFLKMHHTRSSALILFRSA